MSQPFITLTVSPDDGEPYDLDVMPRDVLAWENTPGQKRGLVDIKALRMGDLYGLAYQAARRTGLVSIPRAEFDRTTDVTAKLDDSEDDDTETP